MALQLLQTSWVRSLAQCKASNILSFVLLHFLLSFAQGQGPGTIALSVREGLDPGAVVGSVSRGSPPGYTFAFQQATSLFEISSSGTIRTSQILDREAFRDRSYVIRLFVTGSPPIGGFGNEVTYNVDVTIDDVNDNVPTFQAPDGKQTISFQEDARQGRVKDIVTATDPDAGENGSIAYRIVGGNEKGLFGLDFSGLPLILYIKKVGTESFDREDVDLYTLNISACDGGAPALCGYLTVDVHILDVNDNYPTFDLSEFTAQVNESAPVGTSVFRAEARDDDIGLNGEIVYRLEDDSGQFVIDENTGVIRSITSPLQCSRRCERSTTKCNPNSCFMRIEASDKGRNALTRDAYLNVEVLDENDHDPVIRFRKDSTDITVASVDENASPRSVVFAVTVTDEDSGMNGNTTLTLVKGNEEGYFSHFSVPSLGIDEILVGKALDRETISQFNLTFEAFDQGVPRRSSTAHIVIFVNDANDHAPKFDFPEYKIRLSEFTKPHSLVANVRATDRDEGLNSKLSYTISAGNELGWFAIDSTTGLVTTSVYLDYERTPQVVLNITASDSGSERKSSHVTLTVDILDENDVVPQFKNTPYLAEIEENVPPSEELIRVSTEDLDSGDNGSVEYSIHPDTEMQFPGAFKVNPTSGQVTAERRFDREERSNYLIKVIARDRGSKPLSSTATIELTIKDVNDNIPKFTPEKHYVSVDSSDPAGSQFIRVSAHDKDIGEYGKITYALRNTFSNSFTIDRDTGVISTTRPLTGNQYSLTVNAVDGGGRPSKPDAVITVAVVSSSSTAPVFKNQIYNFELIEDDQEKPSQPGRFVGQVEATTSSTKPITYAINGGDPENVFTIDSSTGVITTKLAIDREKTPVYTLTVIAFAGERIAPQKVTVVVKDLNDNAPEFVTETTEARVQENWPVGYNVFLAQAIDADDGRNSETEYSLSSTDDPTGVFAIDAGSGVIYLAKPPNQLNRTSAELTITATDRGTPRKSHSIMVKVKVEDVNDHTPLFSQSRYELFLSEDQAVNEVVTVLTATDGDEGRNSDLIYAIVRGNEDKKFGIFPDGSLYVAHQLDREQRDIYSLTVVVRDDAEEPRSSSVNITIYVQDENDNAPKFINDTYVFDIMENMPKGTFVGSVKATDNDVGRNAEIIYSIGEGRANFSIDPILGTIFTKKEFDREYVMETSNVPYYKVEVIASDNGLTSMQSRTWARINIQDVNDSPPVFTQTAGTSRAVSENMRIDEEVATIHATDADAGTNAALTYDIIAGNEEGRFGIHVTTGKVYLNKKLDREMQDQYLLTIRAVDTGETVQLSATTQLQIYVLDYNDNAPQFAPDTKLSEIVQEDTLPGATLAVFSGTDKDMSNNAKLRYDIVSGNEEDIFHLDVTTGKLYLERPLDYETKREHRLNITLSDSGFPALSDSIVFKVGVIDVNDNAPEFKDGITLINPRENKEVNSIIAEVSATDKDNGGSSPVTFSIYKQTPAGDKFSIDPNSGIIRLKSELDREEVDKYELTIHAVDQDINPSNRKTTEKTLTISVKDVNDNAPMFNSPTTFLVPYPSTSDIAVASVTATDADSGDNSKLSYSFSGQKPSLFNLNPTTGTVSLARDLPASPLSYTLTVVATDRGRDDILGVKSSTATITLYLFSNTGDGPIFSPSTPSAGNIKENSDPGTSILTFQAMSSVASNSVEYFLTRVESGGSSYGGLFKVHRTSGVLSSAVYLDSEQLPDTFQVDVSALERRNGQQYVTTKTVTITLTDENDNAPVFSSTLFDASVAEDGQPGAAVARIYVTDPDTPGKMPLLTLSGPDAGSFEIQQDTGVVTAKSPLDYEKAKFHNLTVEASDYTFRTSATLHVRVLDENDNAPVFGRSFYTFDVPEDASLGTTVGTLDASDADSGSNGRVTFELASPWGQEYFQLDPIQGTFTLKKALDYEERQLYTLRAVARDEGQPPQSSLVTVYINVKDINDNQPEFDPMSYSQEISENARPGTTIVNVSATDIDTGLNGMIRYSIVGDASSVFAIGPINGSLYTTHALDREQVPVYEVIVMATDQAEREQDRLSTTATVVVRLRDINDSPPEFTSPDVIEVLESSSVDSVVFYLTAVDPDEGVNSQVTYSLLSQSGPGNVFSLDANSGALILKSALDFETTVNHTLVVQAKDGGSPSRQVQQTLVVQVVDTNDNPPVFSRSDYSKEISEDTPIGTSVLRIRATDKDKGFNGAVRYFIIGGEGSQDFHLDISSGVLRVQKTLDYERKTSYTLYVQAEDSAVDGPLRANTTITIKVTDVNDFVPVFDNSPYHTFVQEGMNGSGRVPVITISARDEDSGNNGKLTYSLRDIGGTSAGLFEVDRVTGEVFVKAALDRETMPMYVLTIVAFDKGTPGQTGTATVTVSVKDVNDHPPQFESKGPYLAHVMENQPAGQEVITVSALDDDKDDNALISYSLVPKRGSDWFSIDAMSGKVVTTAQLDREFESKYELTILATDHGIPPHTATAELTVIVDDDNDHAPDFGTGRYSVNLYDSAKTNDFVIGVTAVDRDIGVNGKVTYTHDGPDADYFHVSSETGVVTVAKPLTQEGKRTFTFVVKASDLSQDKRPLTSNATVTVQLKETLDTSRPQFITFPTSPSILENRPYGTPLTVVRATSSRGDSRVTYHIAGGNVNNAFSVYSDNGNITVNGVIDYEVSASLDLWLEARDQGSPEMSTFQKMRISVIDENDNSPQFSKAIFEANVDENTRQGTSVIRVTAEDKDSGENKRITYNIKGGNLNDTFNIDGVSGLITTKNMVVDREKIPLYNLEIQATDSGVPQRTATATVRVTINDMNDNSPTFSGSRSVAVPEDLPIGSLILQLTTNDLDSSTHKKTFFSFVLQDGMTLPFAIDPESGNITSTEILDAEAKVRYFPDVSVTDGAFNQRTTLTIRLLDVNDNAPQFQGAQLVFDFAELQDPNTTVGQLGALDRDISSPNNEFFFSLKRPSSLFELDSETGKILALETMIFYGGEHAGTMNHHILDVVVTDLGLPSLSSEATVVVRVTDANDHAPVFEQASYFSAVPEGIDLNEVILQVKATDDMDFGKNAEVTYSIISGSGFSFFRIDQDTGDIYAGSQLVNKVNTRYTVIVEATDKGVPPRSSRATVEFVVTSANVNTPRFTGTDFMKGVREDSDPGFVVDTITAIDNDAGLNGEVQYKITSGNEDNLFAIDAKTGKLTVQGELDYEKRGSYTLQIVAHDKGLHQRSVSRDYIIDLIDVNDNQPKFDKTYYDAYVRENSLPGTPIFTVTATDADTSLANTQIKYSIVGEDNSKNFFRLDEDSGMISTTQDVFDYEQRTLYTLLVMAFNPDLSRNSGEPLMRSVTTVYVHVTGENEDTPKFVQKQYNYEVSESADMGTPVGTVFAKDEDKGVDGIVYYYLEGQSNLKGFSIDPISGVIKVSRRPDYESEPTISLKVIAKNWGSVKGNDTDTCIVNISISDANDPPEFSKNLYRARIPENSNSFTTVTHVHAEDRDIRPENRDFTYLIVDGNKLGKFQISPLGKIETTGLGVLDRETMPIYRLIVGANDTGNPPRMGTATVEIELTDVNDNAPRFEPENLITYVSENETAGQEVIALSEYTVDADSPPNQGPFRYRLITGPETEFFYLDRNSSLVRTRKVLSRDEHSEFFVAVEVIDNGLNPMTSTLTFTVLVNGNSPPRPRPLTVYVTRFAGQSLRGTIANVRPLGSNVNGKYSCDLLGNDSGSFLIQSACDLEVAKDLTRSSYSLRVRSSDEKFPSTVEYPVNVIVETISNETLIKSVAVVLQREKASTFLETKYSGFKTAVAKAFGPSFVCQIFGLKQDNGDLLVMLAVYDDDGALLNKDDLIRGLAMEEPLFDVNIVSVAATLCDVNMCQNGGTCSTILVIPDHGDVSIWDSSSIVLASPTTELATTCLCPAAFTGPLCESSQERCGTDYCHHGGRCIRDGLCDCPDNWEGPFCKQDVNECTRNPQSLCKNGAKCRNTEGSFECECVNGYHGKYCEVQSYCSSKPCSEHGRCEETAESFLCLCDFGYYGSRCQFSSMSFDTGSYAQFRPVEDYHVFNISLYFATVETHALLVYGPVSVGSSLSQGFVAMEIVDGRVKVTFQLDMGGGDRANVVSLSTGDVVSTGHWYRVEFTKVSTRDAKTGHLIVQRCSNNTNTCEQCQGKRPGCYNETVFSTESSSLTGRYLSIGGVKDFDDIISHGGLVSTHDFRGCMHSVAINEKPFQVPQDGASSNQGDGGPSLFVEMQGVGQTCPRGPPSPNGVSRCGTELVCENEGRCKDNWSHLLCVCPADFTDGRCSTKRQPFTLGANTVITYTIRQDYVRNTKLSELSGQTRRRRRRAIEDSTLMLRFRTTKASGMLYSATTGQVTCMLWFIDDAFHFLLRTSSAVNDPLVVPAATISDGTWHNVTVTASGTEYRLDYDGQTTGGKNFVGIEFRFDSLDIEVMKISGKAFLPDKREVQGLDGCLSQILINGESLPLNGSSDKYNIEIEGDYGSTCEGLCDNNPCGGQNRCLVDGEVYQCMLVADTTGLETGIIVVIVFFCILLIAIIVVFVLFRTRRELFHKCVKSSKSSSRGGVTTTSSNGKVNVHVDNIIPAGDMNGGMTNSRYALSPNEEGMIIRNHIEENLHGQKANSLSTRPDLIGSSYSPQPVHLADGTVIMESADVGGMMVGEEDIPEHYDFENASSIAPSDIAPSDVIRHYRDFRNNTHHHHHHQRSQQPPGYNHLFNKYRDSPASMSLGAPHYRASPHNLPPGTRQSPISLTGSALSVPNHPTTVVPPSTGGGRPSSALAALGHPPDGVSRTRMSPLTQLNVRSPRTNPHHNISNHNHSNSRSNSTQSIGSHHSHSSSSSATGVPNGHAGHPLIHSKVPPNLNNNNKVGGRSRTPKGLTVEDVNRLNARPDLHDPVSMLDAASSSVDGRPRINLRHNILPQEPVLDSSILLEPPDSSSDDSGANDSFTCSEFEYDNENPRSKLDLDPSKRIFSQLTEVENESDEAAHHQSHQTGKLSAHSDGLNSNGDSFTSTGSPASGSPSSVSQNNLGSNPSAQPNNLIGSQYDFDALLNWGPNFDKLVGVFRDIAQLPDTGQAVEGAGENDYEEYV